MSKFQFAPMHFKNLLIDFMYQAENETVYGFLFVFFL